MIKNLAVPMTAISLALSAPAYAQTATSNIIVMMDESGSMSGEQNFIGQFVQDLDAALAIGGFGTRNYGLMGFAAGPINPGLIREFSIGGAQLGSANDFATAAAGLQTPGGTEDGYAAIDYVLSNYTLPAGNTTLVLVTDEDRDNTSAALDYAGILAKLKAANANLVAMVNLSVLTGTNVAAISTDGTTALIQDGVTFKSEAFGSFGIGSGTTKADYALLALDTQGGCVADLNQLRSGGDAAAAFAAAFQSCVINAATATPITLILALPQFTQLNPTATVAQNIRANLRLVALFMSATGQGGYYSTQGKNTLDNMFGVDGLRGYGYVVGSNGSMAGGVNSIQRGFTIGTDYTKDTGVGQMRFGLSLSKSSNKTASATQVIDGDTMMAQVYGLFRSTGGLQVYGDVGYGKSKDDVSQLTVGWTKGTQEVMSRNASLEIGQRFALGSPSNILMPYAGYAMEKYDADTYTNNANVVIPGYDQKVTYGKIGLRWENATQLKAGLLHTEVDASWNRVKDEDFSVKTVGGVIMNAPKTDRDRFDLAVNFGVDMGAATRVNLVMAGSKSKNVKVGTVGLGFEMKF